MREHSAKLPKLERGEAGEAGAYQGIADALFAA
jgi:hypothetical protein